MRSITSSEPIKKFDAELSRIRRDVKSGIMTNKLASFLGVHLIHANTIIKHFLSNSHRLRFNRVINSDILYQRGLSYSAFAFESESYTYSNHTIFASKMITEGHFRRFY
ncbi:MAG TPA: hypothetical protein VH796_10205 [Nitrososphaeraceae archaeon]